MRPSQRAPDQLRSVEIVRHYTRHAEGSVLVKFGDTHVLCTASVDEKVTGVFSTGKGQGWAHGGIRACCRARPAVEWIARPRAASNPGAHRKSSG